MRIYFGRHRRLRRAVASRIVVQHNKIYLRTAVNSCEGPVCEDRCKRPQFKKGTKTLLSRKVEALSFKFAILWGFAFVRNFARFVPQKIWPLKMILLTCRFNDRFNDTLLNIRLKMYTCGSSIELSFDRF